MTVTGRQRLYVSHPINGHDDRNAALAEEIAQSVDLSGGVAVLPIDIPALSHSGPCPNGYVAAQGDQHSSSCYLRADLIEMLMCDGVVAGPDWGSSIGCRHEISTALLCGMPVYFYFRHNGRIMDSEGHWVPQDAWKSGAVR
jgi:hypothetical protein